MAREKQTPLPGPRLLLDKYVRAPLQCRRCDWVLYDKEEERLPLVELKKDFKQLEAICWRQAQTACCRRMKVCWDSLGVHVRALRDSKRPSQRREVDTTRMTARRVSDTVPAQAAVETPHDGLEIIGRLREASRRRAGLAEGPLGPAVQPAKPVRRTSGRQSKPSAKRKQVESTQDNDAGTEEPRPKRRQPRAATRQTGSRHLGPAASTPSKVPGRRKGKKPGEDRDDSTTKGPVRFGNRLYNYFNFLSDHNKTTPSDLLGQDIFQDGRELLPDLDPSHASYAAEQALMSSKGFHRTDEKRAIYRIAKSQTAIAAAIYCEHNLRRLRKAEESAETLAPNDLFSFGPAAIQYFLNRDATAFSDIIKKWKAFGFYPQAMLADDDDDDDDGGGSGTVALSEDWRNYAVADRGRIYEKYIAWEDEYRKDGKILIRL